MTWCTARRPGRPLASRPARCPTPDRDQPVTVPVNEARLAAYELPKIATPGNHSMSRRAVAVAVVALITGPAAAALVHAQPVPSVNAPAPLSVQRGQPAELTLTGAG